MLKTVALAIRRRDWLIGPLLSLTVMKAIPFSTVYVHISMVHPYIQNLFCQTRFWLPISLLMPPTTGFAGNVPTFVVRAEVYVLTRRQRSMMEVLMQLYEWRWMWLYEILSVRRTHKIYLDINGQKQIVFCYPLFSLAMSRSKTERPATIRTFALMAISRLLHKDVANGKWTTGRISIFIYRHPSCDIVFHLAVLD